MLNIAKGTIGLHFNCLSNAKLVLTDDLVTEMLRQRKVASLVDETRFDIIEEEPEQAED